ncbi:MAG: PD40 domain-containing protein [Bacteroidetes bacterium]|nr:PD40 domain-containing protein [Bacteroidota bacterium]
MKKLSALLFAILFTSSLIAKDDVRLLRYPDINGNQVVFVYAGSIWTVDAKGGDARKLTSHSGIELFPKISPDGKWIAFCAEYSGSRQVYVMPSQGGTPKQLTYYNEVGIMPPRGGFDNVVLGWTPDSKKILFRGNRTPYGDRMGKYFLISIDGGFEEPLPVPYGGFGVLSPDGKKLAFAYIDREFRTWKRYKGGRASNLWIYDLVNNTSEQITDFKGTDQIPVWHGEKIYFASDRDLWLNIYSYHTKTKDIKQLTFHKDFDVMWPSGNNGQLIYESGGNLYKLDLQTEKAEKITVNIKYDFANTLPYFKNVKDNIHSYSVSPSGKRLLFDARGDIFSVPAKDGTTRNLTQTQGVREVYPQWSPDGKWITYHSDATGEYEVYIVETTPDAKPIQLTQNSKGWKYASEWSPDSKYITFFDRSMKLQLIDIATKKLTIVDQAGLTEILDYSFSPDSKWITYTKENSNGQSSVWVYNILNAQKTQLTDYTFSDRNPVFSKCGHYIFFTSNRDFNLAFSSFEFNYLYNNATRIYAMPLTDKAPRLFQPKEDEEMIGKSKDEEAKKDVIVIINPKGINNRIVAFPMSSGNYWGLQAVEGGIVYSSNTGFSRYKLKEQSEEIIMSGVMNAIVTADGSSFAYATGGNYGVAPLNPGQDASKNLVNLDNLSMKIEPKKEWEQIFRDGWRIYRDFFYVGNIHNVDWDEFYERYSKLLPSLNHRFDLDYIFGEMIAETNTGHAYVDWGDFERVKRVETGLLGADITPDKKNNRYIISKIYQGENWDKTRISPLTMQGIDIKEGEYLISIEGNDVTLADNPYKFLENRVGVATRITVNNRPTAQGARTYVVHPIASELELFYLDWINSRRAMVEKLSNGRIGYMHLPNTAHDGNRELHRGMYAYHDKEALIIDDRFNGGGFIPDRMIDMLDRKTLALWHRHGLEPMRTPAVAHDGPKVMLINQYASSGGDALPFFFRKLGLGTIIGTRTWGGLVGMTRNASLVDGGYIGVPRFGIYNEKGEWIIEGVGIYPDIEVVDEPHKIARGNDPSLEKAVEVLLKQLDENPPVKWKTPADPDRSKWIEIEIE